jgi:hypothetical protein
MTEGEPGGLNLGYEGRVVLPSFRGGGGGGTRTKSTSGGTRADSTSHMEEGG